MGGNPMMLSMLICYLQPSPDEKGKEVDKTHTGDSEKEAVTLTAVYRVAIDVMLQRVQSRQQADRHLKEEKVAQWKSILERMAMQMQVKKQTEIDADDFERTLRDGKERQAWSVIKAAVEAGHAMFLRTSKEGGRLEMRFMVKGFQNFFAASEICNDEGVNLPPLVPLLTEPWWTLMLEMLAEAWPIKYVKLIESNVEKFQPN